MCYECEKAAVTRLVQEGYSPQDLCAHHFAKELKMRHGSLFFQSAPGEVTVVK